MIDPQLDAAAFTTTLWARPSSQFLTQRGMLLSKPQVAAFPGNAVGDSVKGLAGVQIDNNHSLSCTHQEGHLVIKGFLAADESSVAHPASTFSQRQSSVERSRQVKQLGWSPSLSFLPSTAHSQSLGLGAEPLRFCHGPALGQTVFC